MTIYLLATADQHGDPVLLVWLVVFYVYLTWLLLTSGGDE